MEPDGSIAYTHEATTATTVPNTSKLLFTCGLDRISGTVGGMEVSLMIDSGSEINLMVEKAQEKLGLAVNPNSNLMMIAANNT